MSFAFGFQIEDADDTKTQNLPVVLPEEGVVARPKDKEEEDPFPPRASTKRRPFVWISSGKLTELWRRRRQRDIYCKTAIERSLSRGLDGDDEPISGPSHAVGSGTIPLRHVVLSEWDDNTDNGDKSSPIHATNDEDSSFSASDDDHLYGTEGSVIRNGVYEGGAAVWECSLDLVKYLLEVPSAVPAAMPSTSSSCAEQTEDSRGRFVLELGCGHALPSCVLLQEELLEVARRKDCAAMGDTSEKFTSSRSGMESTFVMVDYNRSVVESITLPNLILNTLETLPREESLPNVEGEATVDDSVKAAEFENMLSHHVVLGSGDWIDMSEQLQRGSNFGGAPSPADGTGHAALPHDGYFDLILAAETLYTPEAALETAQLVMRHLHRHRASAALVASKRYYFGVGGGVDDFRAAIDPSRFDVETVKVVDTGVGNIREILKVTPKSIV